ncbi:GAF domain-containing protein [Chamaesiphon polymorphus]|uniref:Phosphopeptide-binding protein n=1 Tax=Chamaesiphon polymorphus CCALA 037 TaxID=2107692 RepID=A0A2T1GJ25_9CYAN|nr:GAF domain-containing protein [Chamaesiphon polymorphus]PSB57667.1 phosphopeptide-binding protein [Chamaesiphon polymorphus CCALA 037]
MPYLIYAPDTPDRRVYELKPGLNTLGREIDNTIVLLGATVSRHHAEIHVTPTGTTIKDCQSINHTFVNRVQVEVDDYQLHDGDLVRCDTFEFKFVQQMTSSGPQPLPIGNNRELAIENLKQIPLHQYSEPLEELVNKKTAKNADQSEGAAAPIESREQNTVNKLKILLEVSKQLWSPDEPDKLLHKILDLLFQIMNIDRAVILLVDPDTQQLELKAAKSKAGIPEDPHSYSRKIVELAYQSGDAIVTQDAKDDDRFNDSVSIIRQVIQNCMCVPFKNYTEVMGVLYVHNSSFSVSYTHEDLEFLSALANQAAVVIHMSSEFHKREQKLKQQVMELQIQIDQERKENELAEIMSLDSFQKLQERAEKMRNKHNLT